MLTYLNDLTTKNSFRRLTNQITINKFERKKVIEMFRFRCFFRRTLSSRFSPFLVVTEMRQFFRVEDFEIRIQSRSCRKLVSVQNEIGADEKNVDKTTTNRDAERSGVSLEVRVARFYPSWERRLRIFSAIHSRVETLKLLAAWIQRVKPVFFIIKVLKLLWRLKVTSLRAIYLIENFLNPTTRWGTSFEVPTQISAFQHRKLRN